MSLAAYVDVVPVTTLESSLGAVPNLERVKIYFIQNESPCLPHRWRCLGPSHIHDRHLVKIVGDGNMDLLGGAKRVLHGCGDGCKRNVLAILLRDVSESVQKK